ncbi:MAG: oligosaccharide flippase family protein, partial [Candidatus Phytoplasma sp.]|nr:oligosaccharide flippase family protein [Phytoplasma sp.]
LAIILNMLGTEKYGIIVLIQAYALTIDQLLNFQSWQAFIKFGAEALENKNTQEFKQLLKQGTILDISTAFLGTIVAVLLIDIIGAFLGWNSIVVEYSKIYSFSILFHFSGIPTGVLRLYSRFRLISYQKITVAIIKLISLLVAYFFNVDFIAIIWINLICDIIGHILLVIILNIVLIKNGMKGWWNQKLNINKEFFSFAIWSNLSSTLTLPSKQMDVFITSTVLSLEMVGVYKVFKQISSILSRLINPIYQSVYPELANIVAKKQYKQAVKTSAKISVMISIFIIPMIALGGLTSPIWLKIFFGEGVSNYWVYFVIFFTYVGLDAATAPVHPLFNALGYVKQKFYIMGFGNLVYLILSWYLGKSFGLIGIINAWGCQFALITLLKILYIKNSQLVKVGETYAK